MIDSLPSEESSAELQSASLLKLEEENREAAQRLEDIVQQVKLLLVLKASALMTRVGLNKQLFKHQ